MSAGETAPPSATTTGDPFRSMGEASTDPPSRRRPTGRLPARLPIWVLGGAFLGIVVGLAIGPRAAILHPLGIAYSMLLESVIYPYILSSVIGGLGGLVRARAMRLFHASWVVYLFLWIAVFAAIFLLAGAIPPAPPPIEIVAGGGGGHLSLLQALIPDNIAAALEPEFPSFPPSSSSPWPSAWRSSRSPPRPLSSRRWR